MWSNVMGSTWILQELAQIKAAIFVLFTRQYQTEIFKDDWTVRTCGTFVDKKIFIKDFVWKT
jgi:hypothetical protein